MKKKSLTAGVILLVVLHLFAALGCGCWGGLFALGASGLLETPARHELEAELNDKEKRILESGIPAYRGWLTANAVVAALIGLELVVFSVGLLFRQNWARIGAIVVAIFIMVRRLAGAVFFLAFVMPARRRVYEMVIVELRHLGPVGLDNSQINSAVSMLQSGWVIQAAIVMGVHLLGFLIGFITVVVLLLPSTRKSFVVKKPRRQEHFDDYFDDFRADPQDRRHDGW